MRTLVLLAFVTTPLLAAPVPKVAKKQDDAKLLEGRWQCVSLDGGQGAQTGSSATGYWFSVRDGKLSTGDGNVKGYDAVPFTLGTAQSPRQIDIKSGTAALPCIYELDGDTLTWCHPQDGQARPTEFKAGDGRYVFVFKRVKDEEKGK